MNSDDYGMPDKEPGSRRARTTEVNYLSRYRSIEKAALQRLNYYGQEPEYWNLIYANARDIVDQLEIYAATHKNSAVAVYKSAVLFRFNQLINEVDEDGKKVMLTEIERASNIFAKIDGRYSKRDEGPRRRYITEKDLAKIRSALSEYRRNKLFGHGLLAWIDATLITGLRPNEWNDASIQILDDPETGSPTPYLVARNSKRKAAAPAFYDLEKAKAAHPELEIKNVFDMERLGIPSTEIPRKLSRYIPLTEDERATVQKHLDWILSAKERGTTFQQHYDSCRKLLERICEELFKGKKSYTLYSMRHQYAANGKAKLTREEIADRMGHDSIKTAENAYASGRFAHKAFKEEKSLKAKESQTQESTETDDNRSDHLIN